MPSDANLNSLLIIAGWVITGAVIIGGMRFQVRAMTGQLAAQAEAFKALVQRVDTHGAELAYLRGISEGRRLQLASDDRFGRNHEPRAN